MQQAEGGGQQCGEPSAAKNGPGGVLLCMQVLKITNVRSSVTVSWRPGPTGSPQLKQRQPIRLHSPRATAYWLDSISDQTVCDALPMLIHAVIG